MDLALRPRDETCIWSIFETVRGMGGCSPDKTQPKRQVVRSCSIPFGGISGDDAPGQNILSAARRARRLAHGNAVGKRIKISERRRRDTEPTKRRA